LFNLIRDEFDCTSFYICESQNSLSRVHKFTCPPGLFFSMMDCTCDWPKPELPCISPLINTFCKEIGNDSLSTSSTSSEQQKIEQKVQSILLLNQILSKIPFSCTNREIGLHRDALDCSKFYYCQSLNSEIVKHEFFCPSGLHFNINNCQCDWPAQSKCMSNNNNGNVLLTPIFCANS
jgi:hypothetical protein